MHTRETRRDQIKIAFAITGATLLLVGAIVFGAITTTIASALPSLAGGVQRGVVETPLVERVVDVMTGYI